MQFISYNRNPHIDLWSILFDYYLFKRLIKIANTLIEYEHCDMRGVINWDVGCRNIIKNYFFFFWSLLDKL